MNTPALSMEQWELLNRALLADLLAKGPVTEMTAEHVREFISVARYTAPARQIELGMTKPPVRSEGH